MTGLYWLLLRKRASYTFNRVFLLTLPLICAAMSLVTFEIYQQDYEEVAIANTEVEEANSDQTQQQTVVVPISNSPEKGKASSTPATTKRSIIPYLKYNWKTLLGYAIPAYRQYC